MTSLTQTPKPFPIRSLIKLGAFSVAVMVLLVVLGYFPTVRYFGEDGLSAMLLGIGVSAIATWVGLIPGLRAANASGQQRYTAIHLGMLIRLVLIVMLGASAALSGLVPYRPLLIWLAISYLALLMVDTIAIYRLFTHADAGSELNNQQPAEQPSVENTSL